MLHGYGIVPSREQEVEGDANRLYRDPANVEKGLVVEPGHRSDRYPNAPNGKWSSGLCDCCNHPGSCCMVTFCPCITLGQVTQKSRLLKNGFCIVLCIMVVDVILMPVNGVMRDLFKRQLGENVDCGPTVVVLSLASAIRIVCNVTLFCLVVIVRRRVAKIYKIPNTILGNCCTVFWCQCCALVQVARHMFNWNPGVGAGCCVWSPEPMSHWPDQQPISLNEMEEVEHYVPSTRTRQEVSELGPSAPLVYGP